MYQIYRLQWLTCKRYMLPLLHKEFVLISWIFHNFCPTNCFGAHAVNPNVNFHYEQMLSKKVICATTCAPPSGRCCGCGMRGTVLPYESVCESWYHTAFLLTGWYYLRWEQLDMPLSPNQPRLASLSAPSLPPPVGHWGRESLSHLSNSSWWASGKS